ncbi:hypothetical protein ACH419_39370 [Streptomyces bobili]|uniref:hypothetical protein n=1 Tax=Streptomyces bobili TaxID=67280 RepID=UPI0037BC9945
MVTDQDRLTFLGIDPAQLDPAPDHPARADWWPRIDIHSPDRRHCRSCRALATATRIVDIPGHGRRWHDQCRDCMVAGTRLDWSGGRPMEGRYRVTLLVDEAPVMQGWWDDQATADRKYLAWIGERGGKDSVRVTLVDEETDTTLAAWPNKT